MENDRRDLEKQRKTAGRIIALSRLIIYRAGEMKNRIDSLVKTQPTHELLSIRRELELLIQFSAASNPELADQFLDDTYADLLHTCPNTQKLNLTERRILVLTLEEYKTKEIATILNINHQHVLNSRSKIRKILGLQENTSWHDLKTSIYEHNHDLDHLGMSS